MQMIWMLVSFLAGGAVVGLGVWLYQASSSGWQTFISSPLSVWITAGATVAIAWTASQWRTQRGHASFEVCLTAFGKLEASLMDIRDEYGRIVRNPQAFDPTARKLATERLENLFFDAFEAFEDAAFAAREFDAELSRLIVGAGMAICQRIEAAHALSPEQAKEEDYDINGRTAVCG